MKKNNTQLIFLCSGSSNIGNKKLSHRIAQKLLDVGVAEIGTLEMLAGQHSVHVFERRKMIFINDCNASCVKLLTNGLHAAEFLYVDVAEHKNPTGFDIDRLIEEQILPRITSNMTQLAV